MAQTAEGYRYPFPPFPRGWFCVGYSDELKPKDVKPLKYFGKDLVLYRTEAGEAVLLDAHCPHLGAHLGHGGKVCGDHIQCPFHAWEYGKDGQCTKVPYASKVPPRAKVGAWLVEEKNGVILTWFDPEGKGPGEWEIPEIPNYLDTSKWTEPNRVSFVARMHAQEFRENIVDNPHFVHVHKALSSQIKAWTEGPIIKGVATSDFELGPHGYPGRTATVVLDFEGQGLGYGVAEEIMGDLHFIQLAMSTPIDELHCELRFSLRVEIRSDKWPEEKARKVAMGMRDSAAGDSKRQLEADIPIWENKIFRERPLLCDGDNQIMMFRKYVQQFYPPNELEAMAAPKSSRVESPTVELPQREWPNALVEARGSQAE